MSFKPAVVIALLALAGCATTPRNPGSPDAYAGTARSPSWDYPESAQWPAECHVAQQSPVDLLRARPEPWNTSYVVTQATLDPYDRNVVFAPTPGPSVTMEPGFTGPRVVYTPIGFHFHNGPEHVIAGNGLIEMHIKTTDGVNTAVFAVQWRDGGAEDPTLVEAADSLVPGSRAPVAVDVGRILRRFANPAASFYSYAGSLTTPPCTRGIRWFVLKDPIPTNRQSIDRLVAALTSAGVSRHNVRMPKPLSVPVYLVTPKDPRP